MQWLTRILHWPLRQRVIAPSMPYGNRGYPIIRNVHTYDPRGHSHGQPSHLEPSDPIGPLVRDPSAPRKCMNS